MVYVYANAMNLHITIKATMYFYFISYDTLQFIGTTMCNNVKTNAFFMAVDAVPYIFTLSNNTRDLMVTIWIKMCNNTLTGNNELHRMSPQRN